MKKLTFLKSLWGPFKPLKLKLYLGKITIGTPYFLPRKWIKNKGNPGYLKSVPIKYFQFKFVTLGWKTKWGDYRFEHSPLISIVLFKWQFVLFFIAEHQSNYWESWLYYELNTKGTREERIQQCIQNYPQIWTRYLKEGEKTIDYYQLILKNKYLKDNKK